MNSQLSLLNQPRARATDPSQSRAAAKSVEPAAAVLEALIVEACTGFGFHAEGIAARIERRYPNRWHEGTIRTAVSRAAKKGLIVPDGQGRTSRGMKAWLYRAAS